MQCPGHRAGRTGSPAARHSPARQIESFPQVVYPYTLNTLTGSFTSLSPLLAWNRWVVCSRHRATAFSRSVIPGRTARPTISGRLRKSLRPFDSHGLITSVAPTFSSRTARLDSQDCSQMANPPPTGDRQFVPSIVPPWVTAYWWRAAVTSSTCRLATSRGWALDAQGSRVPSGGAAGWSAARKMTRDCIGRPTYMEASVVRADGRKAGRVRLRLSVDYQSRDWRRKDNSRRGRDEFVANELPAR